MGLIGAYRLIVELRKHHHSLAIAGVELHPVLGPLAAADHALVQIPDGVALDGPAPGAGGHQVQVSR